MVRILSSHPEWLRRPSPGFDLFQQDTQGQRATLLNRPSRTIAHRGSEIFVAIGNKVRWSAVDLLHGLNKRDEAAEQFTLPAWRDLKVPVYYNIQQLIVSPEGDYMAVLTSHTVHIAILPDPVSLTAEASGPQRLRTFQLGPDCHVLERSPVVSALWHPLSSTGNCLITVTEDSVVRLWELDKNSRDSFNNPSIGLDLRKLANGPSLAQDFAPSKLGTNVSFSPDTFDMETVSACFGSSSAASAGVWSSMTLWIAMRGGDVYALCPLLPSSWVSTKSHVARLASKIFSQSSVAQSNAAGNTQELALCDARKAWINHILEEQRKTADLNQSTTTLQSFRRPPSPGPVPALQGPYVIIPDADEFFDVTDICTLSTNDLSLLSEDAPDLVERKEDLIVNGITTLLCFATSNGIVQMCLDANDTDACWVSSNHTSSKYKGSNEIRRQELFLVSSITICEAKEACWPAITSIPGTPEDCLVTHATGVTYISAGCILDAINNEIHAGSKTGSRLRLQNVLDENVPSKDLIISSNEAQRMSPRTSWASCVLVPDAQQGDLVLTAFAGHPHAVRIDRCDSIDDKDPYDTNAHAYFIDEIKVNHLRPGYRPPFELWDKSVLEEFLSRQLTARDKWLLKGEIRLSPYLHDLLIQIHRAVSEEQKRLGQAAADLSSRSVRLREELRAQLQQTNYIANQIGTILGDDTEMANGAEHDLATEIDNRLQLIDERQYQLSQRHESLVKKLNSIQGMPMTEKELKWRDEIRLLDGFTGQEHSSKAEKENNTGSNVLHDRSASARSLAKLLLSQSENVSKILAEQNGKLNSPAIQRDAPQHLNVMLSRESALLEAIATRVKKIHTLDPIPRNHPKVLVGNR